jgi:hypothetical protein
MGGRSAKEYRDSVASTIQRTADQDSLQLTVEIDDGSRTIGGTHRRSVGITTPYAKIEVPLARIKSLEFKDRKGGVTCQMRNGDKLQGVLALDSLQLATRLGMITVPVRLIRTIVVRVSRRGEEAGLLAFFPFNGNAVDVSGNGNNGIVKGVVPAEDRFGRPGSAYLFDGAGGYIMIPASKSMIFQSEITVCGWVYPNGFHQGHCPANDILRKGTRDNELGNFFLRYSVGCDENFSPEKERFSFGMNFRNGSEAQGVTGTSVVRPGEWYFVVGTYDGRAFKIYVNGVLEGAVPAVGTITNSRRALTIGANDNPDFPYRVRGILDDIRIYSRALSEDEIQELYHRR